MYYLHKILHMMIWYEMVIYCIELHMVRYGHNVSICIWYEMVINGYGTKMIFTMVRNARYEMTNSSPIAAIARKSPPRPINS